MAFAIPPLLLLLSGQNDNLTSMQIQAACKVRLLRCRSLEGLSVFCFKYLCATGHFAIGYQSHSLTDWRTRRERIFLGAPRGMHVRQPWCKSEPGHRQTLSRRRCQHVPACTQTWKSAQVGIFQSSRYFYNCTYEMVLVWPNGSRKVY
jgi:hypothetical protein